MALNYAGDLARCQKDYKRAKVNYQESIAMLRELDAPRDLASALQNMGHTCLHLGKIKPANHYFQECLALQLAQKNTPGIAECFIGFASLAIACAHPTEGASLLASAEAIGGTQFTSTWAATRLEFESTMARVKTQLTEREFQFEYAAGSALTLDKAVSYAQNLSQMTFAFSGPQKIQDKLSVREREVPEWIAQGMSNAEIADRLVVSKRTIEKHIAHILDKLGLENRPQIIR